MAQEARPVRDDAGRQGEARGASTRAAEKRPLPQAGYQSRLYVDPAKIPDDKVYSWVAVSVLGNDNADHAQAKLQQGWSPVPPDRHPELAGLHIEGFGRARSNLIERGGQVLCEMDKAHWLAIREYKRAESMDVIRSIAWTQQTDPMMPTFDNSTVGIEQVKAQRGFKE